ncbi:MAG: hypothetical protein WCV68_02955 [Candidatus Paceibacterota bacterium]|jgi:hypothetical protein
MKTKKKGFSFAFEYLVMGGAILFIGAVLFGAAFIGFCFLPPS